MEELINRMNTMCSESPFQSGWYLKNLQTNESANYYGDVVVPSASTRKIAIKTHEKVPRICCRQRSEA